MRSERPTDPMCNDAAEVFTEVEHAKCRDVSYAREVAAVLRDNLSKDIVVDLTAPDAERIANTLTFLADRLAAAEARLSAMRREIEWFLGSKHDAMAKVLLEKMTELETTKAEG